MGFGGRRVRVWGLGFRVCGLGLGVFRWWFSRGGGVWGLKGFGVRVFWLSGLLGLPFNSRCVRQSPSLTAIKEQPEIKSICLPGSWK